MVIWTDKEIDRLVYLQAHYCLERFVTYWKETGDFDLALAKAFPDNQGEEEEEEEDEYTDSTFA